MSQNSMTFFKENTLNSEFFCPFLVKNGGWGPQETEGTEVSKDPYRHFHPQGLGRLRGVWAFCGVGRCGQDSGRRRLGRVLPEPI